MQLSLAAADISPLADPQLYQSLYQVLPAVRQKKADRMKFQEGKLQVVGAWQLLRQLLSEQDICCDGWTLAENEYGKPFFPNHPEICFNLSHSGPWVFCIVSHTSVGCDVEKISQDNVPLARRFFHNTETAFLTQAPAEMQPRLFCRLWTLKESYLKASGTGLSRSLNSFAILPPEPEKDTPFSVLLDDRLWFFKEYSLPQYHLAICVPSPLTEAFPSALPLRSLETSVSF